MINIMSQRHGTVIDRVGPENLALFFCPYLCQLLTNFRNSFTSTLWKICSSVIIIQGGPKKRHKVYGTIIFYMTIKSLFEYSI